MFRFLWDKSKGDYHSEEGNDIVTYVNIMSLEQSKLDNLTRNNLQQFYPWFWHCWLNSKQRIESNPSNSTHLFFIVPQCNRLNLLCALIVHQNHGNAATNSLHSTVLLVRWTSDRRCCFFHCEKNPKSSVFTISKVYGVTLRLMMNLFLIQQYEHLTDEW